MIWATFVLNRCFNEIRDIFKVTGRLGYLENCAEASKKHVWNVDRYLPLEIHCNTHERPVSNASRKRGRRLTDDLSSNDGINNPYY